MKANGNSGEIAPTMAVSRDRLSLTFEQAEGIHSMPSQLSRTEVTSELRAVLWGFMHDHMRLHVKRRDYDSERVTGSWRIILRDAHIGRFHRAADTFSDEWDDTIKSIKPIFFAGEYHQIYGFLEFILKHPACPEKFADLLEKRLAHCGSAYRVIDEKILCPVASEVEYVAIEAGFTALRENGFSGSYAHLGKAAASLSGGDYPGSVRESIHAVESVVKTLQPDGDFSKALARLEASHKIHSALKRGFTQIYGYASDEKGIRHSMLDSDQIAVDETDAIFMLGACASFVTYLINRARSSNNTRA